MSSVAFTCARSSRAAVPSHVIRRTLATEALESSSSSPERSSPQRSSPPVGRTVRKKLWEGKVVPGNARSIYVRAWDDITTMPEFFAILRGVEKKFGRVRQFRVARDSEVPTSYMNYFMVEFAEDESLERIPAKGTNIKVDVPVVNRNAAGGPGLIDVTTLLTPRGREPEVDVPGLYGTAVSVLEQDDKTPTRVVEVIVQRAKKDPHRFESRRPLRANAQFGTAFYDWGGFYKPSEDDVYQVPPSMTSALEKWRDFALNDPKFPSRMQNQSTEQQRAFQPVLEDFMTVTTNHSENGTSEPSVSAAPAVSSATAVELTSAPEPAPETTPSATTPITPTPTAPARSSRRDKILARAREASRMPVTQVLSKEEEAAKQAAEEDLKKAEEAELGTLRSRLLKLMGGGRW